MEISRIRELMISMALLMMILLHGATTAHANIVALDINYASCYTGCSFKCKQQRLPAEFFKICISECDGKCGFLAGA